MTKEEVSRRYNIPVSILDEYQSWGLCGVVQMAMDDWQYDDHDLERLGMVMALHDMGFTNGEVETYMRLLIQGSQTQERRLRMLNERRSKALDELHLKERQLERMDYLRFEIRKNQEQDLKK